MNNKTSSKPLPKYRCTQDELYAVCTIGLNSCKNNIASFTNLKPFYNQSYTTNFSNQIHSAAAIPIQKTRNNISETLHQQLKLNTNKSSNKWQALKSYIIQAFPKNLHKTMLNAAGADLYIQASRYNWGKLSALMNTASQFINNYNTELLANNNMPTTFHAEFDQIRDETFLTYTNFQNALENAEQITAQKINANNQIYQKTILMFTDGKLIFRHNRALKERFIFNNILKRVRGTSTPYKQFEIPKQSTITIKKLVANTPLTNIGNTQLIIYNNNTTPTPTSGTTIQPGATTIIQENINTITIQNPNTTQKGKCKTRIIKK